MSVEEELHENIERARDRFDKLVAGNMAIVAALLAIVSVLGQHFNTERLLHQQQSADRWAYYQAKNIRHYVAQATADLLGQAKADPQLIGKYNKDLARYAADQAEIQKEADALQRESIEDGEKAHKFHFGEIFLEVAIVFLSLSILVKRRVLALGGLASAAIGLVWAATAFLR